MVAALECDYERLNELKEARADLENEVRECPDKGDPRSEALQALADWDEENSEELKALTEAAGDSTDREDAEQRIHEDPLSVQVRSDWHDPGNKEGAKGGQFEILLCTGGPACRIIGELNDYCEPESARIEHQDWGTPWQNYPLNREEEKTVLTYCRCFWFGE